MPKEPEPWIERTLREAVAAGEFDDLPGQGKPIADIDQPYDADWWVRRWWERSRALDRASDVAAEVQRRLPRVLAQREEAAVRAGLETLDAMIASANEPMPAGSEVPRLPVDDLIARWRRRSAQRNRA